MCGSFGGKGWYDQQQHFEEQINGRIGGCEAYHTIKLYSLEQISDQSAVIVAERME